MVLDRKNVDGGWETRDDGVGEGISTLQLGLIPPPPRNTISRVYLHRRSDTRHEAEKYHQRQALEVCEIRARVRVLEQSSLSALTILSPGTRHYWWGMVDVVDKYGHLLKPGVALESQSGWAALSLVSEEPLERVLVGFKGRRPSKTRGRVEIQEPLFSR